MSNNYGISSSGEVPPAIEQAVQRLGDSLDTIPIVENERQFEFSVNGRSLALFDRKYTLKPGRIGVHIWPEWTQPHNKLVLDDRKSARFIGRYHLLVSDDDDGPAEIRDMRDPYTIIPWPDEFLTAMIAPDGTWVARTDDGNFMHGVLTGERFEGSPLEINDVEDDFLMLASGRVIMERNRRLLLVIPATGEAIDLDWDGHFVLAGHTNGERFFAEVGSDCHLLELTSDNTIRHTGVFMSGVGYRMSPCNRFFFVNTERFFPPATSRTSIQRTDLTDDAPPRIRERNRVSLGWFQWTDEDVQLLAGHSNSADHK